MGTNSSPIDSLRQQLARANEVILQYERLVGQLRAQLADQDADTPGHSPAAQKPRHPLICRGAKDPAGFLAHILTGSAGHHLRQQLESLTGSLDHLLSGKDGPLNARQAAAVSENRSRALLASCLIKMLKAPADAPWSAPQPTDSPAEDAVDLVRLIQELQASFSRNQAQGSPCLQIAMPPNPVFMPIGPRTPHLLIEAFLLLANLLQADAGQELSVSLQTHKQDQVARLDLHLPRPALPARWLDTVDTWLNNPTHPGVAETEAFNLLHLIFLAEMTAELAGSLHCEQAAGGSHLQTLSLLLPLQPGDGNAQVAIPSTAPPEPPVLMIDAGGQGGRIHFLADMLRRRGCRTIRLSLQDCDRLDSWQYKSPPVALLPIPPFGADAARLVQRLKRAGIDKHIIAIAALERPDLRQQVLEAGAVSYFQQPVSPESLLQFISHLRT